MGAAPPAHLTGTGTEPVVDATDLREYLRPIWRRKWLILAIVALVTAGTYVFYSRKPNVYQAATRLYVQTSPAEQVISGNSNAPRDDRNTQDQATLLHSLDVAQAAANRVGFKADPALLLNDVQATPEQGSDFVLVTVQYGTPGDAANIANAFAQSFIAIRQASTRASAAAAISAAQGQLATTRNRVDRRNLQSRIRQLQTLQALPPTSAVQVDSARANPIPVSPKPLRNAIFAFVLSVLGGFLGALGLHRLDSRVRRAEEVEPLFRQLVVAEVPHESKPEAIIDGAVTFAPRLLEPFRTLRANIALGTLDASARSLLVTSAVPLEGKSTVVRNLALAYCETGLRVLVVDADLRRPAVHTQLQVEREPGLTEVLRDDTPLASALQRVPFKLTSRPVTKSTPDSEDQSSGGVAAAEKEESGELLALASGAKAANPLAALSANRMRAVIDELVASHDIVLIDSPPILAVSDALQLLTAVDGVVLVSRLGVTTRDAIRRTRRQLERIAAVNVLGVVINDIPAGDVMAYGYD